MIREQPELVATLPLEAAQGLLDQANADLAAVQTARDALLVRIATAGGSSTLTSRQEPEPLVDAKEMSRMIAVDESWVRTEQRAGRIPFVHIGRYIRFRPSEVLSALEKNDNGPQHH